MSLINNGEATTICNGISSNLLLARCAQATAEEAEAMSFAASLMLAGECSYEDWTAATAALHAVESRLCAAWEAENGAPLTNRFGNIIGGPHPALRPDLYAQALANRSRC